MPKDDLVKFLCKISESGFDTVWEQWFNEKYCSQEECNENNKKYCENNDKCKFFQNFENVITTEEVAKIWMEEEYEA